MSALALPWRLRWLVWREWVRHPWRHGVVAVAVALGVALAWAVHLVNHSALTEFGAAVRQANGEPDLTLRGPREGFDEALLQVLQGDPAIVQLSAVVEVQTHARRADGTAATAPSRPLAVRVLGIDALQVGPLAPELLPRPSGVASPWAALDPGRAFANAAAARALGSNGRIELQAGPHWHALELAGSVAAAGSPLLVVDIAAAQALFDQLGRLSRIDLRLAPGTDAQALLRRLPLPPGVAAADARAEQARVSNLSRAYRVNLTVLALVALFVGAFLVFAVVALAVAQRTPELALLGVLGLTAGERRALVLGESVALGFCGSALGLLLGTGLAWAALKALSGDLGGGYFPGVRPTLQFEPLAAGVFLALGVASAAVGAWLPARQAEQLQPAQALKGLGGQSDGTGAARRAAAWAGALLALGAMLAMAPPIAGLPLAAYAAVAVLLCGGVAMVPVLVAVLLRLAGRPRQPLVLLAVRRALHQRHTATAAVAGVVASLSLAVALTVMVASFRDGVAHWLDQVLPADLYVRTAGSSQLADQVWFDDDALARVEALPGVQRVVPSRLRALQLDASQPAVTLVARPLGTTPEAVAQRLPFVAPPLAEPAGEVGVYVSEAMVARHGADIGRLITLPLPGGPQAVRVLGVWRDYARQFGTVAIDLPRYRALSGDRRLNELALWLAPGATVDDVGQALRGAMAQPLEMAGSGELRALSLRIFDRSFAVTRWLQVVAVAIGLAGVAASFAAQVLARRKEFGLLAHLGLTRRQVLLLVAAEAAAWMAAGVLLGLALGALVSAVLVHVVNPQSFHWTMALRWPMAQLSGLAALVLGAGVLTAAAAARSATRHDAIRAVKEET